jgi:hypothetical protein
MSLVETAKAEMTGTRRDIPNKKPTNIKILSFLLSLSLSLDLHPKI